MPRVAGARAEAGGWGRSGRGNKSGIIGGDYGRCGSGVKSSSGGGISNKASGHGIDKGESFSSRCCGGRDGRARRSISSGARSGRGNPN